MDFIVIVVLLTRTTSVSYQQSVGESHFQKPFGAFIPKELRHAGQELPARGPGQGGETLSEALFLPDLWAAPGISSVFSPAGWKGVSRKRTRERRARACGRTVGLKVCSSNIG